MRKPLVTLILLATTAICTAQSAEQAKLLARRAAQADAYRKLAEAVYGLQINSTTYVRDFVAESDEIRTEVDTMVKGVRFGTPTFWDDGSCELPAEVTVAKVIETLRTAHNRHYRGDSVTVEDIETIERRIEKSVIEVIGMGAPRVELPPDLPYGAEEMLPPPPPGADSGPPHVPPIWREIGPQARMMAIRAAEIDAKRQLAERIKGLRLTSNTIVRDFVAESDTITTELNAFLVGSQPVKRYLHHDELIAEVTVRVPTEQVITTIKRLHARHYEGDDIRGHTVEDIVKRVVKKDFEATGMGVPPEKYMKKYIAQAPVEMPGWTMGPVRATGEATDPNMNTAQGRLKAARAAEVIAKRNLAEQIAGLRISGQTEVRDFTTQYDHVSTQVQAVVVGATVRETRFTDDSAIVTVELPGMAVWEVVGEELRRQRHR